MFKIEFNIFNFSMGSINCCAGKKSKNIDKLQNKTQTARNGNVFREAVKRMSSEKRNIEKLNNYLLSEKIKTINSILPVRTCDDFK